MIIYIGETGMKILLWMVKGNIISKQGKYLSKGFGIMVNQYMVEYITLVIIYTKDI